MRPEAASQETNDVRSISGQYNLSALPNLTHSSNFMQLAYIIGTSHEFQLASTSRPVAAHLAFESYIREVCEANNIRAICEEMNREALRNNGREHSTLRTLASCLNLPHRYCEASENEQELAGLYVERSEALIRACGNWSDEKITSEIAKEHRWRESYWIKKIQSLDVWPVLFICGSDHSRALASALRSQGIKAIVANENWDI